MLGAGAYGFVMASNYNSRPRPAEVVVDGDRWWVARPRETVEESVTDASEDAMIALKRQRDHASRSHQTCPSTTTAS